MTPQLAILTTASPPEPNLKTYPLTGNVLSVQWTKHILKNNNGNRIMGCSDIMTSINPNSVKSKIINS